MTRSNPQLSTRRVAISMAGWGVIAEMNQVSGQRWQKHQPCPGFQA